jgi:hypothetical protein
MVPKDWKHPTQDDGRYIPLFDSHFETHAADWDEECAEWESGIYPDYADEESRKLSYSEWAGERPDSNDYMPSFPEGSATYYMMYETTSEGTPISPPFETPEQLASWLYKTGASAFADQTASYESWLRVAKGGFACSAVISGGELKSGVEGI